MIILDVQVDHLEASAFRPCSRPDDLEHHDSGAPLVLEEASDGGSDRRPQSGGGVVGMVRERIGDARGVRLDKPVVEREQQILTRLEVLVERPLGYARGGTQLADRRVRISPCPEQLERGVEQPRPALGIALLLRQTAVQTAPSLDVGTSDNPSACCF